MRRPFPERTTPDVPWGSVLGMGLLFGVLLSGLLWAKMWLLSAGTAGLALGFGLLVASLVRESSGEDGRHLRYAGLVLLGALTVAVLVWMTLVAGSS